MNADQIHALLKKRAQEYDEVRRNHKGNMHVLALLTMEYIEGNATLLKKLKPEIRTA